MPISPVTVVTADAWAEYARFRILYEAQRDTLPLIDQSFPSPREWEAMWADYEPVHYQWAALRPEEYTRLMGTHLQRAHDAVSACTKDTATPTDYTIARAAVLLLPRLLPPVETVTKY